MRHCRPPALAAVLLLAAVFPQALPTAAQESSWSYQGATGPEHWGELDPASASCASGQIQSPIDLSQAVRYDIVDPVPAYGFRGGRRQLSHGTLVITFDAGSQLDVDGSPFELVQVHAHAPSEHTIEGRRFPAELHFIHRHASGALAVLAVLLDEGAEHPDLRPLLPPWPQPGATEPLAARLPVMSLLPADLAAYRYEGSLTTPPCSEGVRWLVLDTPLEASAAQLAALADALGGNSRPLQPRNGRNVYLDRP
jgi:carbonic anhydrase